MSEEKPEVTGWMDCSVKTTHGDFFAGIIVNHENGLVKFYIDQGHRFQAANDALAFANRSRSASTFEEWSHCYEIVGTNLQANKMTGLDPPNGCPIV